MDNNNIVQPADNHDLQAIPVTVDPNLVTVSLDTKAAPAEIVSDTSFRKTEIDIQKVESTINGALNTYNNMAVTLRTILTILGILAISLSIVVAAFVGEFSEIIVKVISCTSSICLAFITYFGITSKGNNSRNAWRHLQNANQRYNAGIITIGELIKAYGESEAILGETNFTYQIPTK